MKDLIFPQRVVFAVYGKMFGSCLQCLPAKPHPVVDVQLLSQERSHRGLRGKSLSQKLSLLLCTLR